MYYTIGILSASTPKVVAATSSSPVFLVGLVRSANLCWPTNGVDVGVCTSCTCARVAPERDISSLVRLGRSRKLDGVHGELLFFVHFVFFVFPCSVESLHVVVLWEVCLFLCLYERRGGRGAEGVLTSTLMRVPSSY